MLRSPRPLRHIIPIVRRGEARREALAYARKKLAEIVAN
jgi:hypothetical protein